MDRDDKKLIPYLVELGLDDVPHYRTKNSPSLLAHHVGLYHFMKAIGCTPDLCRAGLYHEIYGVQAAYFPLVQLSLECRDEVRQRLGERTERLVYLNCATDRGSFDEAVALGTAPYRFKDLFTGEWIEVKEDEFEDLCHLNLFDWLEQLETVEKWDYRRKAYAQMAARLGLAAREAHARAYARAPKAV